MNDGSQTWVHNQDEETSLPRHFVHSTMVMGCYRMKLSFVQLVLVSIVTYCQSQKITFLSLAKRSNCASELALVQRAQAQVEDDIVAQEGFVKMLQGAEKNPSRSLVLVMCSIAVSFSLNV